jgi:hypothetical protein
MSEDCKPECWKGEFEGFKPEFWIRGCGGTKFYVML